jgi:dihydropteroate synthase
MLSCGGDAIVARGVLTCECGDTEVLLLGTEKQFRSACISLRDQPFGLSELAGEIDEALTGPSLPSAICLGGRKFDYGSRPLIAGILNVTPDSFSDGGEFFSTDAAVDHALSMESQGASIIDIGGESTRPGSGPVSPDEQIRRVVPVIRALSSRCSTPLSVDTSSAAVAEEALDAGAVMVNDTSAFGDPGMPGLVASAAVPVIIMHMQGSPRSMQNSPKYDDVFGEVRQFLEERIVIGEASGIPRSRILVDPGIGFGKKLEHNIVLIRRLGELRTTGCRVVLGHSRKSFLGEITVEEDPVGRDIYTHVVSVVVSGAADILRVHDVGGTVKSLAVAEALGAGG